MMLPFGFRPDGGVKLKIDGQDLGQGARFTTCVPAGCLVPVAFPTVATDALKKETSPVVTAQSVGLSTFICEPKGQGYAPLGRDRRPFRHGS
ncbi:MAG: invasion associated locus B family protein, partial [Rhodospirillales bacterium]|nr:invasion associated locus B family protein [Rhodospirillales bacterium]